MFRSMTKHHRHSSPKRHCSTHHLAKAWTAALVLFAAAGPLVTPAGAVGWYEDTRTYSLDIDNPTMDSIYEYSFDLHLFNDHGGTRQLLAYDLVYFLNADFTYSTNPNPTVHYVGCEVSWSHTWTSTLDGQPWFPFYGGSSGAGHSCAAVVGPFHEGSDPWSTTAAGVETYDFGNDPTLLGRLTGDGIATVECTHTISAFAFAPAPARLWPSWVPVEERIYDPNLINYTVDRVGMNLTLTYYWIPEPGTLALLLCGAVCLLRRR